MTGLYIHIPFCKQKCPYCDFYTVSKFGAINGGVDIATGNTGANVVGNTGANVAGNSNANAHIAVNVNGEFENLSAKYINNIIGEIHSYEKGIKIDTIYIGGGTPSLLDVRLLDKLLSVVYGHFDTEIREATIEVNPENVNYLSDYKSLEINRISIGVQSLNDENLVQFGRGHNVNTALAAIDRAGKWFDNVSCDLLIYNNSLKRDITRLVGVGQGGDTVYAGDRGKNGNIIQIANSVSHVSMYILKSPKYKLDDDKVADIYLEAVNLLGENNLVQYEISNFGRQSIHNLKYWHCEEYIGLGAGASSLYGGVRYKNSNSLDYRRIIEDENPCTEFERAMLGLRLTEGIELNFYLKEKSEPLIKSGLATINGNRLCLTPKGFLVQNQVVLHLFGDKI
jgi:oxygen-independent coproporphyrinogen-3 oxidase